jgi:hypothetical protein
MRGAKHRGGITVDDDVIGDITSFSLSIPESSTLTLAGVGFVGLAEFAGRRRFAAT